MPASVLHRTPSSCTNNKDLALNGATLSTRAQQKRTPAAKMTAEEAGQKITTMTRAEYQRCTAVMEHGTISAAAKALDCDRDAVARTWRQYRKYLAVMVKAMRPDVFS